MNKKSFTTILCLLGVAGIYWLVQAGDLDPPGPPGSTAVMHSLEDIYHKVEDCRGAGPYAIPQTGQTDSYYPDDDGYYQIGAAAYPRFSPSDIDGAVTDRLTGLIWLKDANCGGSLEFAWDQALDWANDLAYDSVQNCGLGSNAGSDWRLPNIKELQSLIDYSQAYPALPGSHLFEGFLADHYWSSTPHEFAGANEAWAVNFQTGQVENRLKSYSSEVLAVKVAD